MSYSSPLSTKLEANIGVITTGISVTTGSHHTAGKGLPPFHLGVCRKYKAISIGKTFGGLVSLLYPKEEISFHQIKFERKAVKSGSFYKTNYDQKKFN